MTKESLKNTTQFWKLENSYATLPALFFSPQEPVPVSNPDFVYLNESLANDLGLDFLKSSKESSLAIFSGNEIPKTSTPLAQAYAGHQFGHFNRLGDGRAVLLGEQIDSKGDRFDIQLKGSGQTPYSRSGDGRATLYSMLREYLISESMYHLGIPTSRSLAVVRTGEQVVREQLHQGAVLTRIAASHIRVGTFEYTRNFGTINELQALTNYTIERHYPALSTAGNPALELLKAVMYKQIDLVVHWMRVGFIHGVMNTDNMSIAGETIDYGPCAFMNVYDPRTVFSSIDRNGRYAYGNQPYITKWNLAIFANALLPLLSEDQDKAIALAQEVLEEFQHVFSDKWYTMMLGKLGITAATNQNKELVDQLLTFMEKYQADYTHVFLALQEDTYLPFLGEDDVKKWKMQWKDALLKEDHLQSQEIMNALNPKVIPRNHWVENALEAAVKGDMKPFDELLQILSRPYEKHPDEIQQQHLPIGFDSGYQTFCGT